MSSPFALRFTHVELALAHKRAVLAIKAPITVHLAVLVFAFGLEEAVVIERKVFAAFLRKALVQDRNSGLEQLLHKALWRELFSVELNRTFGFDHVSKLLSQPNADLRTQKDAVVVFETLIVNENLA